MAEDKLWEPDLPAGTHVDLRGRGTTFVRHLPGPTEATPVVLLHGWTVTADLNWYPAYRPLAADRTVVALDHRGHGRGIRSRERFRLIDCADDVAALCEVLGLDRVIVAGYSMGGPVALSTWDRHPELVAGLVLCATAPIFGPADRGWERTMAVTASLARLAPTPVIRAISGRILGRRLDMSDRVGRWAASQVALGDPRTVAEAGHDLSRFDGRPLLPRIDVPTAVIRTLDDATVPAARQQRLLDGITGARDFPVGGDHNACITNAGEFVPTLRDAVAATDHQEVPGTS